MGKGNLLSSAGCTSELGSFFFFDFPCNFDNAADFGRKSSDSGNVDGVWDCGGVHLQRRRDNSELRRTGVSLWSYSSFLKSWVRTCSHHGLCHQFAMVYSRETSEVSRRV